MAFQTIAIGTTGTKTSADIPFLKHTGQKIGLAFSGATLPTTLQVGIVNQGGTFVEFTGGTITVLPTTFVVNSVPPQGIALIVTGGSPDFNVDFTGHAGPLSQ